MDHPNKMCTKHDKVIKYYGCTSVLDRLHFWHTFIFFTAQFHKSQGFKYSLNRMLLEIVSGIVNIKMYESTVIIEGKIGKNGLNENMLGI
jgi:hypothetical protein